MNRSRNRRGGVVDSLPLCLVLFGLIGPISQTWPHFVSRVSGVLKRLGEILLFLAAHSAHVAKWLLPHEHGSLPAYFSMYAVILVVVYAAYRGRKDATVISPFCLPADAKLPFSEHTVANALRDALLEIQREAEHGIRGKSTSLVGLGSSELKELKLPDLKDFSVQARFSVEVQGFSLDAAISVARKLFGKERIISGDVVTDGTIFFLLVRSQEMGPWKIGPQPATMVGLDSAVRELGLKVVEASHPTLLAAHEIAIGKYEQALDRLTKLVQNARE